MSVCEASVSLEYFCRRHCPCLYVATGIFSQPVPLNTGFNFDQWGAIMSREVSIASAFVSFCGSFMRFQEGLQNGFELAKEELLQPGCNSRTNLSQSGILPLD